MTSELISISFVPNIPLNQSTLLKPHHIMSHTFLVIKKK